MANFELSQDEADELIAMPKAAEHSKPIHLPRMGEKVRASLRGIDIPEERFLLDISCGRINLMKIKNQLRSKENFVLLRLDLESSPHMNPDGSKVGPNHLHLYREGFQAKFAYELPRDHFQNPRDLRQTVCDFMAYCHVRKPPELQYKPTLRVLK